MVLTVLEQSFEGVTIAPVNLAMTMEDICDEFSLVNRFSTLNLVVGTLRIKPHQFTITLHARVDEFTNVVTTVWPLKFSLAFDA